MELIYRGRFGAAHLFFSTIMTERPRDHAAPVLAAAALVWGAEARDEELWMADSVDVLLDFAVTRAQRAADSAITAEQKADAQYWLGTALGYRARQAELRGGLWRAAREAKAMVEALELGLEVDSACVDCRLGIAVYQYGLARANAMARLVARLVGLGSGNAERALAAMRVVADGGRYARVEARWVLVHALLREGTRDAALREEGLRLAAAMARQYPENPAFQRAADPARPVEP